MKEDIFNSTIAERQRQAVDDYQEKVREHFLYDDYFYDNEENIEEDNKIDQYGYE